MEGLPNLAIVLKGGWETVKSVEFDQTLNTIHSTIAELSQTLSLMFFKGNWVF
jgi:hypothetical protein